MAKSDTSHDPLEWIRRHLGVRPASYGAFFYGRIEQWSPERLPGINCEFDPADRDHVLLKGAELDFRVAVGGGRILDFGTGDGWPALRIAPYVDSVVALDASPQRVEVCRRNVARCGVENVEVVLVEPGEPLPFDNESFDGVVASWSLEETPDLEATLSELLRVMRPGAALRFERVPMSFFIAAGAGGMYVGDALGEKTIVLLSTPDPCGQTVDFLGLLFDLPRRDFVTIFEQRGLRPVREVLSVEVLSELRPFVLDAGSWTTRNPDSRSWLAWLKALGFSSTRATYSGGWFAERLFDRLLIDQRPKTEADLDTALRPLVEVVVAMEAPAGMDAPITAVK